MDRRAVNFAYSFTCRRSVRTTTGARRALRSAARSSSSSPAAYWSRNASSFPRSASSMNAARPSSSMTSFWSGVAVSAAVGVSEAVGLVDDGDVPRDALHLGRAHRGERVRRDHDAAGVERVRAQAVALRGAHAVAVHHLGLEAELGLELVAPLRAERRRDEHEGAPLAVGGELREHEARLDRLA